MAERLSIHQDILSIPLRLISTEAKERYLVEVIIPAMDERRKRLTLMSQETVARKLWALPCSDKPGEEHELAQAMARSRGEPLTTDMASEIADVVYYSLQPNAPGEVSRETLERFMLLILGGMAHALDFAIVKYETRLKYGDMPDHKKVEEEIMQAFFKMKGLPENL